MALKHLILARLMRGPAHGYEMHHEPLQPLHPDFGVTEAHIYASLRSLQKDGYVRHRRIRRRPFPERIRYAITPKGKGYLRAWTTATAPDPEAAFSRALWEPLAIRLYVSQAAAGRRRIGRDWIPSAISAARQRISAYRALLKSNVPSNSPTRTVLGAGLSAEIAGISWLRSCLAPGGRGKRLSRRRRTGRS